MIFQFDSLNELLAMAGHGSYVWASYLITLISIMLIISIPLFQRRQFFKQLQRQQRISASQAKRRAK